MNPDVRRVGALARDERSATEALERAVAASSRPAYLPRLVAERLDHDTHQRLRERVEDLLGTLEALYNDEDLWSRLEASAPGGPPRRSCNAWMQ
ncbi:MAG: hypothetical protein WCF36_11595 [Candidatus Nanopelagicales bacterium]